ncbi:MAG: hypothetical protein KA717_20670 [Woronichinia naegeliana WA131]|jgi:hypothetical protein|uniref:Uncharacterized protein n=1 Tax=Woronichinia naegeliana WA131 TaxID=2824559 RepID=A0A977KRV0_9CYAN|nr:MAG: hypothetical protein KA717_20670 [Woronichinia naegeliana WA131]
MANLVCDDRLPFLSDRHKSILSEFFSLPNQTAQPRELAIKLAIEYPKVVAIFAVLAADGYSENQLLIYHHCAETFVDSLPLRDGMPQLPYVCPYCEVTLYNYDELKFDVMTETQTSICFI